MVNYVEQVMEQYELQVMETARSRGAYSYRTADGVYLLKTVYGSAEKWDLLYDVQQYLFGQKVPVERIVKNKEGQTVTVDAEGTRYLLLKTVEGREIDYRNAKEVVKAAAHLAKLHTLLGSYTGEVPPTLVKTEQDYWELLQKHVRELKKIKNYMQQKRKKSDFERGFLTCCPQMIKRAKQAEEEYQELLNGQDPLPLHLIHGECTQHNLLLTSGGIGFVSWEGVLCGLQVWDLCQFLRKIMEKNGWNLTLGLEMIENYERKRPLSMEEKKRLYYFLSFPEKYWKIANHYYNSAKSYGPGRNLEKLEKMMGQEDNRTLFLELLKMSLQIE